MLLMISSNELSMTIYSMNTVSVFLTQTSFKMEMDGDFKKMSRASAWRILSPRTQAIYAPLKVVVVCDQHGVGIKPVEKASTSIRCFPETFYTINIYLFVISHNSLKSPTYEKYSFINKSICSAMLPPLPVNSSSSIHLRRCVFKRLLHS